LAHFRFALNQVRVEGSNIDENYVARRLDQRLIQLPKNGYQHRRPEWVKHEKYSGHRRKCVLRRIHQHTLDVSAFLRPAAKVSGISQRNVMEFLSELHANDLFEGILGSYKQGPSFARPNIYKGVLAIIDSEITQNIEDEFRMSRLVSGPVLGILTPDGQIG
jgi:hypothetical protein